MKTILTLIAFISISSVALAGEKHPSVTVTSTGEFKIVIDGKQFNNEKKVSLDGLQKGTHYIDVWKKKKGLFIFTKVLPFFIVKPTTGGNGCTLSFNRYMTL